MLSPDFQCTINGQATDGMDEAASQFVFARQKMGRPHDLCQSPQVLSSALPRGCITVPEKQSTKETKQEKHGDRDWIKQRTTEQGEQGETEKQVRQTSRRTGKIKKNLLRQRTSNQGGKRSEEHTSELQSHLN